MTGLEFGDVVLVGDSVFVDGLARPDLEAQLADDPEATAELLAEALHRTVTETIASLPPGTRLFPGHRQPGGACAADGTFSTTVEGVHDLLDDVGRDRDAFVDAVLSESPPPQNYRRIIDVNLGREDIDDEEAFELELGPNNCAAN
jgi:hypothetical protein